MTFRIKPSHTGEHPVLAGTFVTFTAELTDTDPNDVQLDWTITGPMSYEQKYTAPQGQMFYDWNTGDVRGGRYHAVARWSVPARPEVSGRASEPITRPVQVPGFDQAPPAPPPADVDDGTPSGEGGNTGGAPGDSQTSNVAWVLVSLPAAVSQDGIVPVSLQRTGLDPTPDQVLWTIIRNRTNAISFRSYKHFIDGVMSTGVRQSGDVPVTYRGSDAYDLLKQATTAFLMQETGVISSRFFDGPGDALLNPQTAIDSVARDFDGDTGEERRRMGRKVTIDEISRMRKQYYLKLGQEGNVLLPYLNKILDRLAEIPIKTEADLAPGAYGILRSHLDPPAIELIHSYWITDEGGVAQTLNLIAAKLQGRGPMRGNDPLARLDLDPLRPLSNLFWGWAQDEINRLTVRRRAFEYQEEYGVTLVGRAIPTRQSLPTRSKFLEAFHNLLHVTVAQFFPADDDTTVLADGFPVLNALRETHLLLAEGAHNQFGDLPTQARVEHLIMLWLLARPEMREFLGGRIMVPYEEPWMDRVDSMKTLQGWSDASVTHYRDLGVFGEQLLLSIRYGDWSIINDPQQAANWARYWRPELQRYVHAYRSATGVDLTAGPNSTVPALLLLRRRRSDTQQRA